MVFRFSSDEFNALALLLHCQKQETTNKSKKILRNNFIIVLDLFDPGVKLT
jgi:hypothetical protein